MGLRAGEGAPPAGVGPGGSRLQLPARRRRGSLPLRPRPSAVARDEPGSGSVCPELLSGSRRRQSTHRLSSPGPRSPPPGTHRQRRAGGGGRRPGGGAALPAGHGATLPADLGGGLGSVAPTSGSAD